MIKNRFINALSFILILQMSTPTIVHAESYDVEDHDEVDIRHCGTFKVEADLEGISEPMVCRTDNGEGDKPNSKRGWWKTKDAETELHVSESQLAKAKSPKDLMDQVLLQMIREKVKTRFEQFAWVKAVDDQKIEDPKALKEVEEVKEKYQELEKEILTDSGKGAKHEVRRFLTLYPDIEDEILKKHPDYKPLICKYELRKHRQAMLQTCAKTLAITATIVTLVGGPATAYFWIPALPKLLLAAGGTKILAGGLKIGHATSRWDEVRAGRTAKALLDFNKENEQLISRLKKDPEKNATVIKYLQDNSLQPADIKKLKEVKKLKGKVAKEYISGLLNAASGAAAIYGGIWTGKQFKDFITKKPANVLNPIQHGPGTTVQSEGPPDVNNPYVPPPSGGGYDGPGMDDGG